MAVLDAARSGAVAGSGHRIQLPSREQAVLHGDGRVDLIPEHLADVGRVDMPAVGLGRGGVDDLLFASRILDRSTVAKLVGGHRVCGSAGAAPRRRPAALAGWGPCARASGCRIAPPGSARRPLRIGPASQLGEAGVGGFVVGDGRVLAGELAHHAGVGNRDAVGVDPERVGVVQLRR